MLKGCSSFQGRFLTVVVLIILACAVFSWVVDAQVAPTTYPLYTGTDPKPVPPAPALGPANSVITDPTFGTRILRVTDQNTDSGNSLISTETGFKRTFNADSTAIKLSGVGGKGFWLEFNAAAFKVGDGTSRPSPHPLWFGSNWEWSAVDPDIIYFLNGNKIAKYNKSTGVTTNLETAMRLLMRPLLSVRITGSVRPPEPAIRTATPNFSASIRRILLNTNLSTFTTRLSMVLQRRI